MTEEQVRTAVTTAINSLKAETPPLCFREVHERSTAHRLAVHFELLFQTWNVDCEYDSAGYLKKKLLGIAQCNSKKQTDYILPDIIVHHRRGEKRENNLLVVELKKDAAYDECDHQKLSLLTAPDGKYQYQFGLYINIHGGEFLPTWYKDGLQSE